MCSFFVSDSSHANQIGGLKESDVDILIFSTVGVLGFACVFCVCGFFLAKTLYSEKIHYNFQVII